MHLEKSVFRKSYKLSRVIQGYDVKKLKRLQIFFKYYSRYVFCNILVSFQIFFTHFLTSLLKIRKFRKQFTVSSILHNNEWKIIILSIFSLGNTQNSDFLFVFLEIWGHHSLLSRWTIIKSDGIWSLSKSAFAAIIVPITVVTLC